MNILVVIPARGGSKGIPRKNLRLLNNKPLLFYSVNNALNSKFSPDVYVSSEDDEILNTAMKFGAKVHRRDSAIADDKTTLDPVIFVCFNYAQKNEDKSYDFIITMQPTSPLLKTNSLDDAIDNIINNDQIDTVIAAKDSTHLSWKRENNSYVPNYKERLNRQYLTPNFTETGAFLITRNNIIEPHSRIGKKVDLYILSGSETIDIDTYEDWQICEYHLKRKNILFVVTGNKIVGLGHVYNTLLIANDIMNHNISFLVDKSSKLALEKIRSRNYPVLIQENDNIIKDIEKLNPDLIINDKLDTSESYIKSLKNNNWDVINFEDLGSGSKNADLVINAIYPEKEILNNHYFGHRYFILRDEFIYSNKKSISKDVKKILLTFGGVDPNNLTKRVLSSISSYCGDNNIKITVITGFGYDEYDTLEAFDDIDVKRNVSNISEYMLDADIIFTSAGRTTYEIASIGTPAIVLAQNSRELTHFFASSEFGFLNLGLGSDISNDEILNSFKKLVTSESSRRYMNELMLQNDLKDGRKRVNKLIQNLVLSK